MRRKDREIKDKSAIKELLDTAGVLHLGMFDGERPYVVPVNYGYDVIDDSYQFYIHSAKHGRKIEILEKFNNVFIEIVLDYEIINMGMTPCDLSMKYKCFMADGIACRIDDFNEKSRALKLIVKQQTGIIPQELNEKSVDAVHVYRIITENATMKSNIGG